MSQSDCAHRWRRVFEEFLMGGAFPVGWECVECRKFVDNSHITPTGLGGVVLEKAARLTGPHGGCGNTADGRVYKQQIVDENGELHIEYL